MFYHTTNLQAALSSKTRVFTVRQPCYNPFHTDVLKESIVQDTDRSSADKKYCAYCA
jgi:hypothetical protein